MPSDAVNAQGAGAFFLRTFGCKTNQYESQGIREILTGGGWREASSPVSADALVVNTCAVTGRAGATCRNAIRSALRENPALRVCITGCAVDVEEAWLGEFPAVVVPNAQKHRLPEILLGADIEDGCADRFGLSIHAFSGHTRAFLKIQDGCDNFCSYCIIPKARGLPVSRTLSSVVEEAKGLVDQGVPELVLTGINIGAWREEKRDLSHLIESLAHVPGLKRLRLGSVELPYISDRLLAVMAAEGRIAPHLHLPIQSGADEILRAMNRRYDADDVLRCVERIRRALSSPGLSTDVIVGFPGESDAHARQTYDLCSRIGFQRMHVFPFSVRSGTPAESMRPQVPSRVAMERRDGLITLAGEMGRASALARIGAEEDLLLEEQVDGVWWGYTGRYQRGCVEDAEEHRSGALLSVRVMDTQGASLRCACI